jgi:small subunit ribosomal protein S6
LRPLAANGIAVSALTPRRKASCMSLYEHVFLARQDVTAQQVQGLINTYKTVIEENGGKVGKTEYWGLKSITYKIKKNRKAHYVLINIDAPHAAVAEMERQMRISTDVIRFMTLRMDKLEEGPSAAMRRSDEREGRDGGREGRGDRDGRGGGDRGPRGPRREGGFDREGGGFRDREREGGRFPRRDAPAAIEEVKE